MRYLIGFFVSIGLIILVIVLLFSGGSGNKTTTSKDAKSLISYANTDAQVRVTIDGPVSANLTHQQSQVTVDRNDASFNLLQGYDGQIVRGQSYANNEAAFDVFLHALALNAFTSGNSDKSLSDERGYCSLGERYVFELIQDGKTIQRYWATSCGGVHTYYGNLSRTLELFRDQIPDYQKLNSGSNLY